MSLLLDALKKAEKAKEEAQRRAEREAAEAGLGGGLSIAADAPEAEAKPVRTRDQLPDISQPLQIESEDIAPARQQEPERALELEPAAPPATRPTTAAPSEARDAMAAERAAAKKVFEAKFKEPNPRLPFYITLAALGAFGIGTAGYFWYQLRPPPPLAVANPPLSGETPVAAAMQAPQAASSAQAGAPAQPDLPGLPAASAPAPAASAPAASAARPAAPAAPAPLAARPVARARPAAPAPRTRARRTEIAGAELLRRDRPVAVNHPAPQVDPHVAAGYAAYQAGDLAAAHEAYRQALGDDASNRDALLGMAAVEMRAGRYDAADALYRRLLQADPRDAHAQAGLLALRSDLMDPVGAESRVKTLLANDPGASVLYFTLGNEYARQGRWAEAQQSYFKAFTGDPDNPDFAYNVAVSLDHLRQPKPALEYYQRALALAAKRSASFDQTAARKRAQELGG